MTHLSHIDAAIVLSYFCLILGVGIYMERRAGKNIETYFLGKKTFPWWLLGMSGSSTFFDIAGTMWMVSVLYMLGMRAMWEYSFFAFPFAGVVMVYKAKWGYRSGVLTGMEWLVLRYGEGKAGQAARLTAVGINLLVIVFMLGYAGIGVGKFLEVFLPYDRSVMVPILFAFTGLYVVLGGFFSVVLSDFIQTALLSAAAVYISISAFLQVDPVAFRAGVGDDWFSLAPVWRLANPLEEYPDIFGLMIVLWVWKGTMGLISVAGGGADFQRFRAAKNEGDASRVGFAWGMVIAVRWSLVMAFAVYGLSILTDSGGPIDSESVLPRVLGQVLPIGIKGIVVAGFVAAFMSTFDSSLNVAASFITNDLVRPNWKSATPRQLMWTSYVSTVVVIVLGILISLRTESIAGIWNPINFALGAAIIAPSVLTSYWWRINGWCICASAACTLPVALYIKVFTDLRVLQYFPILFSVSLGATLIAAFAFPSTPMEDLTRFYEKIRPFGFWGPVRKALAEEGRPSSRPERDRYDIPNAVLATVFFVLLYVAILDVVVHNWGRAIPLGIATLIVTAILYFSWWKRLPQTDLE